MNRGEVEQRVIRHVIAQTGLSANQVLVNSSLKDDLGMDSLDFAELEMRLETDFIDFSIKLNQDIKWGHATISEVTDYLLNQVSSTYQS